MEQPVPAPDPQVVEETEFGSAIRRGAWCHLGCLNERLHPRHLVQEWKFSPEEIDALTLARYRPDDYRLDADHDGTGCDS